MSVGLFRIVLPEGSVRLARGAPEAGPTELLPATLSIDALLAGTAESFREAVRSSPGEGPVPEGAAIRAPIESQEVWGAGVTYLRSREGREEESELDAGIYGRVYAAGRPEVFFKSAGWRVRGPREPIGVRSDSAWNAPEPELALVLTAGMEVAGYAIGNDVSSREIEGENPLYLPQAKIYDGSCALGPAVVVDPDDGPPFDIRLAVVRDGSEAYAGATTTGRMKRSFDELASCLGSALEFPVGAVLLTGTGIVPDRDFTLRPADVVRIEIDGLGTLENAVVAAGRAAPAAG
ncbi:MAG: fumarylacetoacetate hydrolase family protein [Actinomycetota bacterium]